MTEVHGFVGNFDVTIKKKARYVNENICTGCGACTEKCPMRKVPNEFNLGMDNRSAIYIPFAQAIPKVATIDPEHCMMLKSGKCGLCSKVCTAGAIDYKAKDEFITENTAQSLPQPGSIRFHSKSLMSLHILNPRML